MFAPTSFAQASSQPPCRWAWFCGSSHGLGGPGAVPSTLFSAPLCWSASTAKKGGCLLAGKEKTDEREGAAASCAERRAPAAGHRSGSNITKAGALKHPLFQLPHKTAQAGAVLTNRLQRKAAVLNLPPHAAMPPSPGSRQHWLKSRRSRCPGWRCLSARPARCPDLASPPNRCSAAFAASAFLPRAQQRMFLPGMLGVGAVRPHLFGGCQHFVLNRCLGRRRLPRLARVGVGQRRACKGRAWQG